MTRVVAYAIMRNEERNVPDWLVSVSEADSAYVLDTGSTDGTVAALRDAGVVVYEETWRGPFDFATARNHALRLVPSDTDLCVWLDADERLTPGWRAEVDEDPDHLAMGMLLDSRGAQAWRTHPRVQVHNPEAHRWFYPVHEQLHGPAPTRSLESRVLLDNRHRRSHSWLEQLRAAVDKHPRSARIRYFYGRDLTLHGMSVKAEAALRESLELHDSSRVIRSEAMRLLYDITDDVSWLNRAIDMAPRRREAWVDMCVRLHKYGRDEDAAVMWKAASTCTDEWLWTTFHYAWDAAFEQLGRDVGAL